MKIKCADKTNAPLVSAAHFLWRGRAFMPVGVLYGCRMVAGWCLWEGLPDRSPDVQMCCRAGRYTGVGWSPQRVVGGAECVGGQDCPRGRLDDCRARTRHGCRWLFPAFQGVRLLPDNNGSDRAAVLLPGPWGGYQTFSATGCGRLSSMFCLRCRSR